MVAVAVMAAVVVGAVVVDEDERERGWRKMEGKKKKEKCIKKIKISNIGVVSTFQVILVLFCKENMLLGGFFVQTH